MPKKIVKPENIKVSPYKSKKWDEITKGRDFRESDTPVIALLCQWYQVVEQCIADLDCNGEIHVAYENDLGDIKACPQIATMKQASAEIRALNKQLGINDEVRESQDKKVAPLYVVQQNRQANTTNRNLAKSG